MVSRNDLYVSQIVYTASVQPVQTAQPLRLVRLVQPVQQALRSRCTGCRMIVCPLFGLVPSCMGVLLSKLSTMLSVMDSLALDAPPSIFKAALSKTGRGTSQPLLNICHQPSQMQAIMLIPLI